jgi:hypothetical protein
VQRLGGLNQLDCLSEFFKLGHLLEQIARDLEKILLVF